jgi:DNA-binding NarL/FixJ family response regulator
VDLNSRQNERISLYLVDDVPELRALIRHGLEVDHEFEVVGEAGDGRSAVEGVAEARPAATLLDLSMPDMDGLEAIPEIRKVAPDAAIVILSGFAADRMGRTAMNQGADGYVEKGAPITEVMEATRRAVAHRRELGGSGAA